MNLLPLIERELRVGARQTFTYSLRVAGVGALLAAGCIFWLMTDSSADFGARLFVVLHCALLGAIWVLVPMLTADCISRERREGTLALLFLTPLRPANIVVAKAMAQGLRAFTLWLAALPALAIPFVAGGVGWKEAFLSTVVSFSSLWLAMAAGLVASARCRNATRSLAAAGILSILFVLVFPLAMACILVATFELSRAASSWTSLTLQVWNGLNGEGSIIDLGFWLATDWDGFWATKLIGPGWGRWSWVVVGFGIVGASSLFMAAWLIVRVTARTVERVWREEPPSARVLWLQRKFTTPIFCERFFRRWMRWELQRNPLGWLERRSWSARLVMWGWTAVVICVYSSLFANVGLYERSFYGVQIFQAGLLVISIAASATGSFRRERENGVLELLLVAPLTERQIIGGRLRGLWGKFLLPETLLVAMWFCCLTMLPGYTEPTEFGILVFFVGTFATLPVIGLYYSLARKSFISAFLWTLLAGIALPWFMARLANTDDLSGRFFQVLGLDAARTDFSLQFFQAALAVVFFLLMRHHLQHRKFAV